MPSQNPYGCVFCPTYLLAFLVVFFFLFLLLAGAFFLVRARGAAFSFASAFGALGAAAAGAPSTPATRISTWLVRFRIGVPPPLPPAGEPPRGFPSVSTGRLLPPRAAAHRRVLLPVAS